MLWVVKILKGHTPKSRYSECACHATFVHYIKEFTISNMVKTLLKYKINEDKRFIIAYNYLC